MNRWEWLLMYLFCAGFAAAIISIAQGVGLLMGSFMGGGMLLWAERFNRSLMNADVERQFKQQEEEHKRRMAEALNEASRGSQ